MIRLRRTIGIVGVLLMLMSSMGSAVYAQEEGVAVPNEAPAATSAPAGDDGVGDTPSESPPAEGEAGNNPATEPLPPTGSVEEEPSTSDGESAPAAEAAEKEASTDDAGGTGDGGSTQQPEGEPPVAADPPADAGDEAAPDHVDAPGSDTPVGPPQTGEVPAETRREPADSSVDSQALEVGEPDANASVAITGLSLSCDGIMTFTTVVNVTYERFEGGLILDIYEGDPAAGGEIMTVIAPSQGAGLLAGTTAYSDDLGWSTSILANPYAQVRWTLTAWNGPTGMDYVGEWRGSESAAMGSSCGVPGDGDPTNPGDGDPTNPGDGDPTNPDDGDPTNPGVGLTSINGSCDGVLNLEVDRSMEILAMVTANGSGVGESWRFSATPGQHTHDFWADGDPAATADDVVFAVYEYNEPRNTFYTTLSCSGKPFYDVEQFDLTCEGVLTVAYGERQPEFPLYTLYDGETGERLTSSRSFLGTEFAIEPGVYDSLYAVGEDNWPTLPVYFIAEATVTGCLGGDPDPDPQETGQIALSLALEGASGNPDTSADGAAASWTVEPADSVTDNPSANSLRAAQTDSSTYTAVLSGGVASTTTGPLPLGSYRVCLDNTLTGGPGGDVSIGASPICEIVELTEAGATTPAAAAFTATIQDGSPDPDPGDGDGTTLKVVSVTIDSPNLCTFMGGTATVTGTTQVEGYDSTVRADLSVGWETLGGAVTWGSAHQGPGGTWVDRVLEVNGPWSISKTAWDPTIGGKDVGVPRPADATAVFVTLELRERLTAEPDAALTVRYSLADCGSIPDPNPDTGRIELSFRLVDGAGNADTSADGATASWTVEPLDSFASNPNVSNLRAVQSTSFDYSAVLAGGVASTTTDPLPLGSYRVCLDNILLDGPNGDISVGDGTICDTVKLTEAGASAPVAAAFIASIQDSGHPAPVIGQDGRSHDAGDAKQPAANGSSGASSTAHTSTAAGTSTTRAGQTTTTLPVAGAGPSAAGGTILPWLMVASFLAATAGFAIRRRATA